MSELHFHSIQDYKINVNGIEIKPVSEETRSFEVIGGDEHGVLNGLDVKAVVYGGAAGGGKTEYNTITFSADLALGQSICPKVLDFGLLQVLVWYPRKRRANFKPHMRRRLKAINRGRR